jgi:hypothetical protein
VIPKSFQSARVLKALNVFAVGGALAALTASVFGVVMQLPPLFVGLPTFGVGLVWAAVLRARKTIGNGPVRWGWLASVPLAALNAAIACGLLFAVQGLHGEPHGDPLSNAATGAFLGATIGALYWIPALILTLIAFGAPIAWSQMLARKGLAGEESGERIVGVVSCVLSLVALLAMLGADPHQSLGDFTLHFAIMRTIGAAGVLTGGAAAILAQLRERRRRDLVARASAGELPGFRVDDAAEGKVLVRVTSQGQGYRVADFHEEVFLLDEEGRATKARAARR